MDAGVAFFLLSYLLGMIVLSVVAVQKGKTTMMVLGWLFCSPLIIVAACRIAKPTSAWAREKYVMFDEYKLKVAEMRFPKEAYIMKQLSQLAESA